MFDDVKLPTQVGGSSATLPDQNSFASTEVILDFQRQEYNLYSNCKSPPSSTRSEKKKEREIKNKDAGSLIG